MRLAVCILSTLILQVASINSPPRIFKQPPSDEILFQVSQKKINENDKPFVIECEAEGEPRIDYYWMKNGKNFTWSTYDERISKPAARGTLTILRPAEEDVGQYQCFAENALGIATSNSVFVRKAELNSFKDENPVIMSAKEGSPFKLTCHPPDGWPKPNVYWLIQDIAGGIKSINNSRMTIDPEGNLFFSNVTKADVSDDFYYACAATSVFRNEYKIGNKVILTVNSESSTGGMIKHKPEEQYLTRRSEVALRGKKIELFCIYGGTPLPQIIWSKNGESIKTGDRISQGNYGKSLIIKHVNFDDQGTYTCEASNGVGSAKTHSINLQVMSVPYFTVEPEIVNAAEDETAEIKCEASGVPAPEIKWVYNGRPLSAAPPNSRRKLTSNSIIIERLVKSDTANYGCNATNSLGYVYKDVYINVLALEPEITQPPTDMDTVDGKTILITCRVFGAPKPEVKWIKNGQELTGGRYKILETGDLQIEAVSFLDAGTYTCHASNKLGQVDASATLMVKEHTRITDKPEDYEVAAGSSATFRCNAVTDSSLTLTIDWYSNGQPIEFEIEPRFVRSTDYSLMITKTIELDSGIYTCVARTELDEARAQATLIVQDVPFAPRLEGIMCNTSEAKVTWIPMGDNRAPILRYTIQYNTSFTPDVWEIAKDNVPASLLTEIIPMSPWSNYTFRVIAWNKIGPSLPSPHSDTICTTIPTRPTKNPDNVAGKGTTPQNLVITWTTMPQIDHNGDKFMYKVYYKRDIPGLDWIPREVNDWRRNSLEIDNQPTYQRYKIKVISANVIGESKAMVDEVVGYSGEDVPLQAPGNFTLLHLKSSTTAQLSWTPVPEESVRGELQGYKIQTWTEKQGEKGMHEIDIHGGNTTQAEVSKFIPYSKNFVRILAYNGRYVGPVSEILSFETPEGVPGTVLSLEAFPMGSSALFLVWTPPAEPNGILTGYRIYYQVVSGTRLETLLERKPHITDADATSAKLAALASDTKYRVHIRATTKEGPGNNYFIEQKTRMSQRPDVPQFTWITVPSETGYSNIKIVWEPNLNGNPGSHFFVKYKLKGETIFLMTDPEFQTNTIEIRGLQSGELYTMSVVAVDGEYLTESPPQDVETSSEGPIIQPKENVATAGWFIGMMLAIAILLLVLIVVCVIKRNRGGKYAVHERELAAGRGDYPDEGGFHEYSQPLDTKSAGGRASLASSSHQDGKHPESDTDSMAEYGDGDTGRFTEDGSFIGQYGPKGRPEETPPIPTGTMATYV
ncbi:PREDICTED: neuroglian isoform X1 [Dinoponera quadriceps]|uniref:Neuroglian isoform X1 n=1 Tax=Dinoponera quadriceps TaxID=609295 RepID=A0A6P3X504_DINQU|nr:PREDICTED: neuroglian isoform X1 [Dinoponera quadriceps]XP_014473405.1 PREDICTED: neuroglian isoform X1 [Dinoponera quadriceps]XP_014473406.1 PREDICTED: neuroglian isoform X1 [Dinoponera quadriceps]